MIASSRCRRWRCDSERQAGARRGSGSPASIRAGSVVEAGAGAELGPAALRSEVARLFVERLDRERPLWRIDVARLEGGGAALIWRLHHALADGTTAMRFARMLLWDRAGGSDVRLPPRVPPMPRTSAGGGRIWRGSSRGSSLARRLRSTARSACAARSPLRACRCGRCTTPHAGSPGRRSTMRSSAPSAADCASGSSAITAASARSA